ncbi:MAG: ABC transporter permease [Gammaproteobacteria bacterium]|jgi:ABC-type dipeptide/oligopeptide/nickel transport system permease subunit|nr:peptide ABC transporter permease [Chromatiales bacterium]MCP4924453.1 ABC transporter permease [Gammaproteobacteria bacterium]MDP7296753.1 ABC transporter permease [Gammaproteobacteria bacterium]MDP7419191.1 ABC transporter permease [Gammaproteobacteria bacterium]MDP7660343.1 ABC transporter permease [Gammaproteobacteria bacterium]
MNTVAITTVRRESLWSKAFYKFSRDRTGMISLVFVLFYMLIAFGVTLGWLATDWSDVQGGKWEGMSTTYWFGTNMIGQDIFSRAIYSTKTAFEVGLVVALIATAVGAVIGAISGFFSGTWIDEVLLWLMGVLDSIPFYLFVAAIVFAMQESPYAMHVAMISTFWTGSSRLVRGEVIKLRGLEYVEAAHAIGVSELGIIFRHILPNTTHILLVQATITFVAAIKSEVILSFLGLGVKDGMSWGLMIAESSQEVMAGFFNNFLAASVLMFGLVMAFNMFSDALQDALDPRKVS